MNNKSYTLITGASGGIGYELALLAAGNNKNLVVIARSQDKLDLLAETIRTKYKVDVKPLVTDLSLEKGVQKVIDLVLNENLSVEMLINNAGFGDFGDFAEADLNKNIQMINLNVVALTQLTHFFLNRMKKMGTGRIMNVASTAAFMPGPGMAVYYASKAYVLSFSEALTRELKGTGVTMTALCPGPTDTGFALAAGLRKSSFHSFLPAATAADVAKTGYKAMLKGKAIEIPGFMNKLSSITPRIIPRNILRNIVYRIHKNY